MKKEKREKKIVSDIPSWTSDAERARIAELAGEVEAGELIVEIGALYGGTTSVIALSNPKVRVISIDEFSWTPEGFPKATQELLEKNLERLGILNVSVIKEDSRKVGPTWSEEIALCFIDGGHSFEYVYPDLKNFSKYSRVIAMHDYGNPFWATIQEAVNKFLGETPEWYIDNVVDTLVTLRKK